MYLQRLVLADYRNYERALVDFSPQTNQIFGANGQGKSNLLEAVYFLSVGRSFRGSKGHELIRSGGERFSIDALFEKRGVSQRIQISYGAKERLLLHNESKLPSFLPLLGLLTAVIFSPDDRQLISGPPAVRRRFLDLHLSQTDPLYVYHLSRYSRALKQRNRLLQSKRLESIGGWEREMARSASYLTQARKGCIEALELWASELQRRVSGGNEALSLNYRPASPLLEEEILEAYCRSRSRESLLGHTIVGPHRDELLLLLDDQEARSFASEGQRWCCAIALRLAEWHRLADETGDKPLMLLDDATAPLDPKREERFYQLLEETGQLFFAAPEPLALPPSNQEVAHFSIESGAIHSPQWQ